jgi:hypothetical protein
MGNFILQEIIIYLKLGIRIKYYFYKLKIINGKFIDEESRIIEIEIIKIILEIPGEYLEYIIFNIIFIK